MKKERVSKFLSWVLRHEPEAIGLTLDSQGWTPIETLISQANKHGRALTVETVMAVVESCPKKRYSLSEDGLSIRAAQGHSTSTVAIEHTVCVPPDILYHGTATKYLLSIQEQGLVKGSRHAVHLSTDIETAKQVGARHARNTTHQTPVILQISASKMVSDGYEFTKSDNDVWLIPSVPKEYLHVLIV